MNFGLVSLDQEKAFDRVDHEDLFNVMFVFCFFTLGVYMGSERGIRKNWEGLSQVGVSRLARWRWLLSQVSYRGRVLIINLATSSLWHKLAVLNPPDQSARRPATQAGEFVSGHSITG